MEKKNIVLLYGGRGYEREISLSSAEFILSNIDREIFEPYRVFIAPDGGFFLDLEDGRVPCSLKLGGFLEFSGQSVKISAVFPVLHGDFGEDGRIQGYLDCLGIPYVGCGTLAGALSSDKAVTKTLAERLGIPTAPFLLCRRGEEIKRRAELTLGYPMFVKPCSLGSSIGIFEVRDEKELDSALKSAHSLCDRVILEEKIPVLYEVECAFFETEGQKYFEVGSIFCDGFYDYEKKYINNGAREIFDLSEHIKKAVSAYSLSLVKELDLRQLSRLDFFLTKSGDLLFNEINTLPGFTETSLYPKLMERAGFTPGELITRLLSEAMA